MAIFTPEQLAGIVAAKAGVGQVQVAVNAAHALLESLDACEANAFLVGKVSGDAIFADAVTQWGDLRLAVIAAANALP